MDYRYEQEEDHSVFNQTTEVGITLTGEQARILNDSLDPASSLEKRLRVEQSHTHPSSPTLDMTIPEMEEDLDDTEVEITPKKEVVQLEQNLVEQRFLEMKRHVLGFHSLLEKGYETSITVSGFTEFPEIRLRSISVYPSGALYIEGENRNGEWVSIFSQVESISYALTKQRCNQRKKSTQEIEFNFI